MKLLLLVVVLVFYRHSLFSSKHHIPWDLPNWHLPQAVFQAREIARGELPLWDPWTYAGRPFAANPQTQSFYPPRLLTVLMARNTSPHGLLDLLEWELAIHVWLAGIFTVALARRLGLDLTPSFLAGCVFALGCYFTSQAQHIGAVEAATWLPACCACLLDLSDRLSWKAFASLSFSLSMALLAGFTPVSLIVFAIVLMLAIALRVARVGALAIATSLALSAVMLLPAVELTMHSVARYRTDWRGTGGGIPLLAVQSVIQPSHHGIFDLASYKLPYEITFLYLYCGIVGLGLAIFGMLRGKALWRPAALVLLAAVTIWMFGDSTPIGPALFAALPPLLRGSFYPQYLLALFSLGMALFAGLGLQTLRMNSRIGLACALIAAADLIAVGSGRPFNVSSEPVPRTSAAACGAAISGPRLDIADYAALPLVLQAPETCTPSANGYDPMALSRYMDVRLLMAKGARWGATYPIERKHDALLRFLAIGSIASKSGDEAQRGVLPRCLLVKRVVSASREEALRMMGRQDWQPRETAYVEGPEAGERGSGSVELMSYRPDEIVLHVHADGDAFLVSSEVHYPGWEATVDGVSTPVRYTNAAFRGMTIPAGNHTVVLRFAPALQRWGMAITVLSLLFLVASRVYWR